MRVVVPVEQCWHEVPGGTARTTIDLAAALDRRADVDVLGVAARHRVPAPRPWTPPVPVRHSRLPRLALYEGWHGLRRPLAESLAGSFAGGPADVCHAMGGAIPGTRLPLVVTVHDLAFLHFPELFTRHGNRFFRRALRLTRDEAAQVQVPSQATFDDCVTAGIAATRLRVVPWGFTPRTVTVRDVDDAKEAFGLPDRWIVCVGTLEPRKNLKALVEAWRRLGSRPERLVLVGPTGWGDQVDGSRLPENVSMTGFVDDHVRDALYAGAVASCYPSIFEGFGLPVLESLAHGCPVVTSSGTATEELVADGGGVAVDPRDPDAIAHALARLLDDDDHRAALSSQARAVAEAHSWERAAALAVAGYEEVLAT